VLTLRGRFGCRHRRGQLVFDPSRAVMERQGEEYVSHHPDGGDECLVVKSTTLLAHLAAWQVVPLHVAAQVRIHDLAAHLDRDPADVLEVEEALATIFTLGTAGRRPAVGRWRGIADEIAHEVALRFDEPLPLSTLAAQVGVSPFAACRLFRRVTGSTIHGYQLELRLRHAVTLLLETRRPLADIALATGFANQGHFGNHFRRRYGLTPGRLRTPEGRQALAGRLPAEPARKIV
jgi:AraC family transcriptional regulator